MPELLPAHVAQGMVRVGFTTITAGPELVKQPPKPLGWLTARNSTKRLPRPVRPKLRDSVPGGLAAAADEFDRMHHVLSARMKRAERLVSSDPGGNRASGAAHALNTVKKEVLRRRFPRELKTHDELNDGSIIRADYLQGGPTFCRWRPSGNQRTFTPVGSGGGFVEGAGTFGGSNPYGQQLGGAVAANGRGSSPLGMKPGGRGSPMSPGRSGSPGLDIRVSPVPTTEMVLGGSPPLGAADAASLGAWHGDGSGSGGGRNGGGSGIGGSGDFGGGGSGSPTGAKSMRMQGSGGGDGSTGRGRLGRMGTQQLAEPQTLAASRRRTDGTLSDEMGFGNALDGGGGGGIGGSRGRGGRGGRPGQSAAGGGSSRSSPDLDGFAGDQYENEDWEAEFDPMRSLWAPRAAWCDAKDLFDTESVITRRFEADLKRAIALGMSREIGRNAKGREDAEVQEVREVLQAHHETLVLVHAYYAATQSSELRYISLNGWTKYTEDFRFCRKSSRCCMKSDLDRLFIAVDTMSMMHEKALIDAARAEGKSGKAIDKIEQDGDRQKALSRVEFIIAMVFLAINWYIKSGEMSDVSDSLEKLITVDIEARLHPRIFAPPDEFRRKHAYTMEVTYVLQHFAPSLRCIFDMLAVVSFGHGGKLVSLEVWMNAMRALGLMNVDLAERDILLCFSWSRMAVVDGSTKSGASKELNLPFEGLMEALCRVACMKALPTDDEIFDAECMDAGTYLARLQLYDTPAYEKLINERKTPWGGEPTQPSHRCVAHLLSLIIRRIKVGRGVDGGEECQPCVNAEECEKWSKLHRHILEAS